MAVLATDAFGRTVAASSWGNADSGGAWTTAGAAGVSWSVNGSKGVASAASGSTGYQRLASVSDSNTEMYVETTIASLPNAGNETIYVEPRSLADSSGASTSYRVAVTISSTGSLSLVVGVNATGVLSSGTISGITVAPGDTLATRVQAFGTSPTTIRGRSWKTGTSEPSTWQVSTTDSTSGLQVAGSPVIGTFTSSSATNGPFTISFDNLSVQQVGNTPPTVNAGADLTISAAGNVPVSDASATDPDGFISTIAWTCTAAPPGVTPSAVVINSASTASPTFVIPNTAGRYTFDMAATDNGGTTVHDTKNVFWPQTNVYATAVDTVGSGWALFGGGDTVTNLNDALDTTGEDSPASTAGSENDLTLVLAPLIANPASFEADVRAVLTSAATGAAFVVKLVDQGVTRKTWTKTSDLSTSTFTSVCTLTSAEIATITNWNDLRLVIGWTAP